MELEKKHWFHLSVRGAIKSRFHKNFKAPIFSALGLVFLLLGQSVEILGYIFAMSPFFFNERLLNFHAVGCRILLRGMLFSNLFSL